MSSRMKCPSTDFVAFSCPGTIAYDAAEQQQADRLGGHNDDLELERDGARRSEDDNLSPGSELATESPALNGRTAERTVRRRASHRDTVYILSRSENDPESLESKPGRIARDCRSARKNDTSSDVVVISLATT